MGAESLPRRLLEDRRDHCPHRRSTPPKAPRPDPWADPANHIAFAAGTAGWTQHEVTAQIPPDAGVISFGVFVEGGGQLELRHPELTPHPA